MLAWLFLDLRRNVFLQAVFKPFLTLNLVRPSAKQRTVQYGSVFIASDQGVFVMTSNFVVDNTNKGKNSAILLVTTPTKAGACFLWSVYRWNTAFHNPSLRGRPFCASRGNLQVMKYCFSFVVIARPAFCASRGTLQAMKYLLSVWIWIFRMIGLQDAWTIL